jgi:hypothetical protein
VVHHGEMLALFGGTYTPLDPGVVFAGVHFGLVRQLGLVDHQFLVQLARQATG